MSPVVRLIWSRARPRPCSFFFPFARGTAAIQMSDEETTSAMVTRDHVRAGVVLGLVAVAVYLWHPEPPTTEDRDDPLFQAF